MTYLINIVKVLCTVLIPFTQGDTAGFSVSSLLVMLLIDNSIISMVVRITVICIILLIWLAIIVLSVIGIKQERVRVPLFALSIIAALFDCVVPLMFSAPEFYVTCVAFSAFTIAVNLLCIINHARNRAESESEPRGKEI